MWLISIVNLGMYLQKYFYWESLITITTWIWLFLLVCGHMSSKLAFKCKYYITKYTLMRFLSTVYQHMSYKITISVESPVTMHTMMWFLPTVYFDMSNMNTISGKALSQYQQWVGFSPLCILICLFKVKFGEKKSIMNDYIRFLSSVCIQMSF